MVTERRERDWGGVQSTITETPADIVGEALRVYNGLMVAAGLPVLSREQFDVEVQMRFQALATSSGRGVSDPLAALPPAAPPVGVPGNAVLIGDVAMRSPGSCDGRLNSPGHGWYTHGISMRRPMRDVSGAGAVAREFVPSGDDEMIVNQRCRRCDDVRTLTYGVPDDRIALQGLTVEEARARLGLSPSRLSGHRR